MELKHLNEQEFNTVKNGTKPAMIDFFATWCGPCKMVGPVLEKMSNVSGVITLIILVLLSLWVKINCG